MPRGGHREGAGRPTLYPGKTERVTVSLTPQAVAKAVRIADALMAQNPDVKVSISDAHEFALSEVEMPAPRRAGPRRGRR